HKIATFILVPIAFLASVSVNLQAEDRVPNIILILADDLGYGDLGCFGQQQIRTPELDHLAQQGMRLTSFYAGSTVCAPSRCTLMTGLHTGHCLIRGNRRINLRPQDFTVAELLKEAGYATALCGKWGLGAEGSPGLPTRQGFDYFYGYLDQGHAHNYYPTYLIRNEARVALPNIVPREGQLGRGVASEKKVYSHDLIMKEALGWVEANHERPFFLYLAVTIPHANNEAGDRGMEVPTLGEYADRDWPEPEKGRAAMISYLDRDVGRLLQLLEDLQVADNTLIIFSSDNGPHNEGGSKSEFFKSAGIYRGSKRYLYEGGIRVPTIARWPGVIEPGSQSDHPGAFWDFLPTVAEIVGSETPEGLDGISFLPTLQGLPQPQHKYLYWEFHEYGKIQALRFGRWKAIRGLGKRVMLYDLAVDPREQHEIADEEPRVVARAERYFEEARSPSEEWPWSYEQGK
ncbi:MAG: N-acetylgalactosamine-6-sulfatase, partial [Planctomycetota bacterium]